MTRHESSTDVCIVGAGPHGLAAAVHLHAADPELRVTVLDPSGGWLSGWHEQFARAEIDVLRSPVVHHPAPGPYALADFIDHHDLPRSGLEYGIPTTAAFRQFCEALVEDIDLAPPLARAPRTIRSHGKKLLIEAGDATFTTRHLIVATNPHQRNIPDWIWSLVGHQAGLVAHASDVDLRALGSLSGQNVAIIGGGLSAAHLAIGAAARGANVELIARQPLNVQAFDTAPGWLGPKYLAGFEAECNPARRLAIAERVRSGGSIPEWMHDHLVNFDGPGEIKLREATTVGRGELRSHTGCRLHLHDGTRMNADRVWLATGTQADPHALRCLRPLLADVGDVHGFPLLDEQLRLGPHPAFMMGRSATINLGPAAGNLWGAQRAANRITEAITGVNLEDRRSSRMHVPASRN